VSRIPSLALYANNNLVLVNFRY